MAEDDGPNLEAVHSVPHGLEVAYIATAHMRPKRAVRRLVLHLYPLLEIVLEHEVPPCLSDPIETTLIFRETPINVFLWLDRMAWE